MMWDGQNQDERGGYPLSEMNYKLFVKRTIDTNIEPILMYDDLKVTDFAPKFTFNQQAISNSKNKLPFSSVELGTEYIFEMQAVNPICESEKSKTDILTHRLKPDMPGCVRTKNDGKDIEVEWIAPNDNEARITQYIVKVSKSSSKDDANFVELDQVHCPSKSPDFILDNAMPGCKFSREVLLSNQHGFQMGDLVYASVSAVNNIGTSEVAFSVDCGPEAILADPPNPPINLKTD